LNGYEAVDGCEAVDDFEAEIGMKKSFHHCHIKHCEVVISD